MAEGPGAGPRITELDQLSVKRMVERAKADPSAFADLYDLYFSRVYAYAYRRLGSRAEAEDVTAETFLAALGSLSRFTWQAGGFGAWLFRIARNAAADANRRRSRQRPLDERSVSAAGADEPGSSIDDDISERETLGFIRRVVARLPVDQREAVLLKYSAGLSNREIAAATGRSPTAVSSLVHRAMTQIRERLRDANVWSE